MAIATPQTPIQSPAEIPLLRRARPMLVSLALAIIGVLLLVAALLTLAGGTGQLALFYAFLSGFFLLTTAVRMTNNNRVVLLRALYMLAVGVAGGIVALLDLLAFTNENQTGILWVFFALAALYVAIFYLISALKSDPLANVFYFINAAVIVLGIGALLYFIGVKAFSPFIGPQHVPTGTVGPVNIVDFFTSSVWRPLTDFGSDQKPSAGAWPLI